MLGTTLAVAALATAVPGAVATASTQAPSDSPKLTLSVLDRNQGILKLTNVPAGLTNTPWIGESKIPADVLNGGAPMQPYFNGTEAAQISEDGYGIGLKNLARGTVYSLSVKFTDPDTRQVKTSNTVTFTTPASTDTQPPTTPTNLKFVPVKGPYPNLRQLTWKESTDNADRGKLQYIIMSNGFTVGNQPANYTKGEVFTVTAIDSSNNESDPARIVYDGK